MPNQTTNIQALTPATPAQTSVGVNGIGAPQHSPTVPLQIYKDTSSGKTYVWIGSRWY